LETRRGGGQGREKIAKWDEAQTELAREFQIPQPRQVELSISESIGVKTGWKQKTVQKAKIESWSSFGFQYSKEDDVYVFFFFFLKHLWRWKIIGGILWDGHAGAAPESAHCSAPVNKTKVF
jgi:hypothetical protein